MWLFVISLFFFCFFWRSQATFPSHISCTRASASKWSVREARNGVDWKINNESALYCVNLCECKTYFLLFKCWMDNSKVQPWKMINKCLKLSESFVKMCES